MEFRLSENTVNSYDTYCTERDKYKTGANPGGGWKPLKDWFEDNGFDSTYNDGDIPHKADGSTGLMECIGAFIRDSYPTSIGTFRGKQAVIGVHSVDGGTDIKGDGNGSIPIVAGDYGDVWDLPWGTGGLTACILLVRPL